MRTHKLFLPATLLLALTGAAFAQSDGSLPSQPECHHMHHAHGDKAGHFMQHFDLNNDGKVTRAEFDQVNADRFNKMDKNGDGVISADELAQFHQDGPPRPSQDNSHAAPPPQQ